MTNIDAADNQRGVVGAEEVLARVAAFTAAVVVQIPANVKALWVIAEGGIDPLPTVIGDTTAISYPTYLVPFTWSDGGPGVMVVALVSSATDAAVTVTCSPTPNSPWYVVGDTGGRFSLDVGLQSAMQPPGLPQPLAGVMMAGTDGTNLRFLLTDSTGKLEVTGSFSDAAEGTPGAAPPAKAIQVAGSDGTDLRVLLMDGTGHLLTIDQVLTLAIAARGAGQPADVVQVGGSDGTLLRPFFVDTAGRLRTVDLNLALSTNNPGGAAPADAVQVGGSDGTLLRALRVNGEGVAYAIPSAPDTATGDHPPNELLIACLGGIANGGTLLAAAGAGKRYRIFSAAISNDTAADRVALLDSVAGGGFLQTSNGPLGLPYGPSGVPLSTNAAIIAFSAGGHTITATVVYTLETA